MKNIRDPFVETPEGFHLTVENTLMKLEDHTMKRTIRWSALAIAAVMIMITATGFAAAGLIRGIVDWDGNLTPVIDSADPNPTPPPKPAPGMNGDVREQMHNLIEPVPEMEYWEAETEFYGSGKYGSVTPVYEDMEAFLKAIEGFDDLTIVLPDGYTLLNAEVYYDMNNLVREMYAEETFDDITLRKYRITPPAAEDRYGYGLSITAENDRMVSVHVFVYQNFDEAMNATGTFYVDEDDAYRKLELPGFDRTLLFERGDDTTLIEMIRTAKDGQAFTVSLYGNQGVSADEMLRIIGAQAE